jgi:hypothetical protein
VVFGGLQGGPGELADPDHIEVGPFHQIQVSIPSGFGPLLGIPRCSEQWSVGRDVGLLGRSY